MDYGWIMFAQMNIQQAVDDAGRYASTGQESDSAGSRISSIINVIQTEMKVTAKQLESFDLQRAARINDQLLLQLQQQRPDPGKCRQRRRGGPESTVTIISH